MNYIFFLLWKPGRGVVTLFIYLFMGVVNLFIYLFMGGGDYFYLFIYRVYYFIYLWAVVVTLFTYLFFSLFLKTSFLYIYIYNKHYKLKYFHAENLILKIYVML